jgi:hypothetical protein
MQALIVFELPGDIIARVLGSWIGVQALAKLDTAVCGFKARTQFLELVEGEAFIADAMYMCPRLIREKHLQQLGWLTKRRIKAQYLVVNGNRAASCTPDLLKLTGRHLRSLTLHGISPLGTATVFSSLSMDCNALRVLKIENCEPWETLGTLNASAQQTLQELYIDDCHGHGGDPHARFSNLQKLHLKHLSGMDTLQSVTSLLRTTPSLTDLRLASMYECPVDNESLQVLCNHAAGLRFLQLDIDHQRFTPAAVVSLAERCNNLKALALTCGDGVNDAAVEAFALHCSRLEGLRLTGTFTAPSLPSLPSVAMHCGPRLRYLALDMKNYYPTGLTAIAEHCQLLEELQLDSCDLRNGGALIQQISSSLRYLRELLIGGSTVVTDEVLIAIAAHLPKLQHLGLQMDRGGYTEAGALALVTSLTQLQQFSIDTYYTSVFTPALRQRWQEASPGLKIHQGYVSTTRYFKGLRW